MESDKDWNYSFNIPANGWTWGPLDPTDGMSEEEFEEFNAAAIALFGALAVKTELSMLEEIDAYVDLNEPVEAKNMLDELFKKPS